MARIMQLPIRHHVQNPVLRNLYFVNIFRIFKLIGMFPYRLRNGFFIISVPYCILSTIVMCFVFGFTLFIIFQILNSNALIEVTSKDPLHFGLYILNIFQVLLYSMSVVTSFFRAPLVNEILLALDDADRLLSATELCVFHHFPIKYSVKELFCGFLTILLQVYVPWSNSIVLFAYRVYLFLLSGSVWVSCAQFSVIGRMLLSRIAETCDSLNGIRLFSHSSIRTNRIILLSDTHSKLCDTCAILQTSYSKLLTVLISVGFFGITISSFYVLSDLFLRVQSYSELITPSGNYKYSEPMIRILTVLIEALCVWEIVDYSSKISKKIQEFHVILYSTMLNDKTKDVLRNEKLKLHICMKREVTFTASGFFPLDYTLIHSMVAAVTSYIVILNQFQQATHLTSGNTTILDNTTDTSFTTAA